MPRFETPLALWGLQTASAAGQLGRSDSGLQIELELALVDDV